MFACDRVSYNEFVASDPKDSISEDTKSSIDVQSNENYTISVKQAKQLLNESLGKKEIVDIKDVTCEGRTVLYAVNLNNGWALVSADSRNERVLAYSDIGMFDIDNIPNPEVRNKYLRIQ